ncbi:MFS transporter [Catellatospora coxensis]|uniref:MFS transporter n=1 Tax=Catellatospora coxensis TaxID=310354 RepID=A0A8J3L924_9ACTN|nr:MFS transporter [Catellatospora coxensis]GIG08505.1 MFS transporter [Catellatospora coxensis]
MGAPNRWLMLGLGMLAQGACYLPTGALILLVPALRAQGYGLGDVGLLLGAPSAGMVLALIAWGWCADRYGERLTMTAGLACATLTLTLAAYATGLAALGAALTLAGAACASGNAASGRVVLGWFPPQRRGFAMGLRQTALPVSGALAGLGTPLVAQAHGVRGVLLVCAAVCLVSAVAVGVFVVDPPRPEPAVVAAAGSPYRTAGLWRIHGASLLLVVPQFTTSVFAVAYLVGERGWSESAAGRAAAAAYLLGGAGRLVCGRWSDAVASRLRPMRQLAVVNAAVVLLVAGATQAGSGLTAPLLVLAVAVSMSGNGLSYTAVAEHAGPVWAGRALGTQNTVQNVGAALTPAALGLLIAPAGYGAAFALAGALALLAAPLTPAEPG